MKKLMMMVAAVFAAAVPLMADVMVGMDVFRLPCRRFPS